MKPYTQLHTRVSPVPTHGCGGVGGGQWVVWGLVGDWWSFGVVAMRALNWCFWLGWKSIRELITCVLTKPDKPTT